MEKNWKNVSRRTKNDARAGDCVYIQGDGPEGRVLIIMHSSGRVSVRVREGRYVTIGPGGAVVN